LDVAEAFRERVFKAYSSVILTSATLSANGSFGLIRSQLGAKEAEERLLASPFRFAEQAGLYVASDLPDPKAAPADFEAGALARCAALLPLIPGGVFILFTSWGFLRRAERLLEVSGRPVFKQGDAPPARLIEEFRGAGNGVLLGTSTFWEGVDVPGAALSAVILTKLPFASPESPYEEAKQEWLASRGIDAFQDYQLPKAIVKFRQGFGRLIRSRTDRGIVAVLDPRVRTKRYGPRFLKALPACRPLASLEEVANFYSPARML
jgi:ATP-dependent DNA helicase DinG